MGRVARIKALRRILHQARPDVVLAHSALPNIYARLAAPVGTPVVTVLHSASDDFAERSARLVEKVLLLRTSHVVAVSPRQQEKYLEHFGASREITVIPNGIRSDIRCRSQSGPVLESLVTVARIASQKNPVLWTRTAELLHRRGSTVRLTWWGPMPTEMHLQSLVSDFETAPTGGGFAGPTNDPPSVLEAADALFHPADREAHSIGILEAAAAGLPIVCSRAVADTLPPNVVTVPFADGEPLSAVQAIFELSRNWQELSASAISAAADIAEEFSIDKCSRQYVALFERLVRS